MEYEGIALENLTISQIARFIFHDWKKPYFGAKPYLRAMLDLETVDDNYMYDSGRSVVNYFLANATTWRGETAREVKKELKKRVKS